MSASEVTCALFDVSRTATRPASRGRRKGSRRRSQKFLRHILAAAAHRHGASRPYCLVFKRRGTKKSRQVLRDPFSPRNPHVVRGCRRSATIDMQRSASFPAAGHTFFLLPFELRFHLVTNSILSLITCQTRVTPSSGPALTGCVQTRHESRSPSVAKGLA